MAFFEAGEDTDLDILLTDFESVKNVYTKSGRSSEFLTIVYDYFNKHGKIHRIFKWAAKDEINSAERSSDVFGRETIFTGLLRFLLATDLGKRFCNQTLVPILADIHARFSQKSFEDSEEDIEWLLVELNILLNADFLNICPLVMREAFFFLSQSFSEKFSNEPEDKVMTSVIFFKYLGKYLLHPTKYGIIAPIHFKMTPNLEKVLKFVHKILECASFGIEFEPWKPHSSAIDQFLSKAHSHLLQIVELFLNEESVLEMRELLTSSMNTIVVTDAEKMEAVNNLKVYLSTLSLTRSVRVALQRKMEYARLLEAHYSTDWKLKVNKDNVATYVQVVEGTSSYQISKTVTRINCDMKTVYEALHNMSLERIHPCNIKMKVVEKHDDEHSDYHCISKSLPFEYKDWVFTRWDKYDPSKSVCLGYSITRSDTPPCKKINRGLYFSSGSILVAGETPDYVTLYQYNQTDERGSFPFRLLSSNYKDTNRTVRRFKNHLEGTCVRELLPLKVSSN